MAVLVFSWAYRAADGRRHDFTFLNQGTFFLKWGTFFLLFLTFPYFLYTLERQKKKGKRTAAKEKRTAARGKEQEKNRKKKDRGPCLKQPGPIEGPTGPARPAKSRQVTSDILAPRRAARRHRRLRGTCVVLCGSVSAPLRYNRHMASYYSQLSAGLAVRCLCRLAVRYSARECEAEARPAACPADCPTAVLHARPAGWLGAQHTQHAAA